MAVPTAYNYFTSSVCQDLVEGETFYFAWFLQEGVVTSHSSMILLTKVLEKEVRL